MTTRPYRRAVQAGVIAFMFLVPVLNLFEIYAITGTFYAVNIGGLGIADPSAVFQAAMAAGAANIPLITALVFPVVLALLLGRVWCGWMCPYHVLSDGAVRLRGFFAEKMLRREQENNLPIPSSFKANMSRFVFLLFGTILAGAAAIPVLNYVNAPAVLSTEAMILVKEHTVSIEFGFIVALFAMELLVLPRFWCRLFCPTGAVLSVFRLPFTLHVTTPSKNPGKACCSDEWCSKACPMGLRPYREGRNLLCTNCGRCLDACVTGRLRFSGFDFRT